MSSLDIDSSHEARELGFADSLRVQRISMGMDQRCVGRRIGVTAAAVSGWECGRRLPKAELIPEISNAYKIDAKKLARLIVTDRK